MNNYAILTLLFTIPLFVFSSQGAFGASQEKLELAAGLEETLGHFIALEMNLDDGNAELAIIHATHPVAELYDLMKPVLVAHDPNLDMQMRTTLVELKDRASTDVSRAQAQQAIVDARELVEMIRMSIVGEDTSNDTSFQLKLMKGLLETSIAEYGEAVEDGQIIEMAEFQDGSAFVMRSQQIFENIRDDIDSHEADSIDSFYMDLERAYDSRVDISVVETNAGGVIQDIDRILGMESEEADLLNYVENIRMLLLDAKQTYADGDKDLALSMVTKAYLNNYEFLEGPLIELDERDRMIEVEIMLREDLRNMLKNDAPPSEVNAQIDAILEKMDTIAMIVPEFGTIAIMILVVSILSIVAITSKSRLRLTA